MIRHPTLSKLRRGLSQFSPFHHCAPPSLKILLPDLPLDRGPIDNRLRHVLLLGLFGEVVLIPPSLKRLPVGFF